MRLISVRDCYAEAAGLLSSHNYRWAHGLSMPLVEEAATISMAEQAHDAAHALSAALNVDLIGPFVGKFRRDGICAPRT
ncbi:hypothetical protein [Acidocella aminolytica]|uniref:hypothetical protein n=1 Tax=Acidocella aminolytica TaxID=33998 RepID=UPI001C318089|nr:hypothetical protein [Acidocella aminolytica]